MMSRQTLIALAGALVLGLVAVFFANSYLNRQRSSRPTPAARPKSPSLQRRWPTGPTSRPTRSASSIIRTPASRRARSPTPRSCCPPGKKRVALMPIAVNEPILADKISGEGQGASIAALLPDGMRAASVRINDVSGVAGFVQPNDSVDVLITRQPPGATATRRSPTCCFRTSASSPSTRRRRTPTARRRSPKTATLEVNPLDAQKLALAQQVGDLSLVLRKPGEQNNPVVETVSMNDLRYNMYGGARYPAPAVVGSFGGGDRRAR